MFSARFAQPLKCLSLVFLAVAFSSCSKKQSEESATLNPSAKNQQVSINSTVSTQADQQAALGKNNYTIKSIGNPVRTTKGYRVDLKVLLPSEPGTTQRKTMDISTMHENGLNDSINTVPVEAGAKSLSVQARCSSDACFKYVIILTVRTGAATAAVTPPTVYQNTVISFRDDCKFNSISAVPTLGKVFTSLNEAEEFYSITPRNDIFNCSRMNL